MSAPTTLMMLGGVFTPRSITGLYLWLRSDLGITLATGVSAWADQSGNGDANRNVTQATGSAQPIYTTADAAFNNQPTLRSTGTQYLASGVPSASLSQPSTIFVCGTMTGGRLVDGSTVVVGRQTILDGPNWSYYAGSSVVSSSVVDTTKCVACAVFSGASSALYLNNMTTAAANGNPGTNALARIGVLGTQDGAGLGIAKVAEIIAYAGALTLAQRLQVANYMGQRYGVTIT